MRSLADRILVIYEGEIVGEFPPDATEEELGIAMTGGGRSVRGGGVSERAAGRLGAGGRGRARRPRRSPRRRAWPPTCRAAGVIVPVLTAVLAFFIAGGW